MKKVVYRKSLCKIAHVWFSNEVKFDAEADITFWHGVYNNDLPVVGCKTYAAKQDTLISDLESDENILWEQIRKNYRYEIRRAIKEKIVTKYYVADQIYGEQNLLNRFEVVYNQMYESKGMKSRFNRKLIEQYIKIGAIVFSIGFSKEEPLVFHSYIYDEHKTRFFYSCSLFRVEPNLSSFIGRINKCLHWQDIMYFKAMGLKEYDWGGINNTEFPNTIAQFKLAFGGINTTRYNYIVANTLLGKVLCSLKYKNQ